MLACFTTKVEPLLELPIRAIDNERTALVHVGTMINVRGDHCTRRQGGTITLALYGAVSHEAEESLTLGWPGHISVSTHSTSASSPQTDWSVSSHGMNPALPKMSEQ